MQYDSINSDQFERETKFVKTRCRILMLHKQGYNSLQIAAACGCDISIVRRILKEYEYMMYKPYQRKVAADA